MSKPDFAVKSYFAFTFAIIAIHLLIIGIVVHSKSLVFVSGLDSLLAIILGLKTDSNLGHAGIIIGIFGLILSLVVFFY
jgi:hypothetical protein